MKTSLSHLPETKQEQINAVANAIIKLVKPEKVILFGSYANGKYVEDQYIEDGITFDYISDYDFLIVTKDGTIKDYIISDKIVNRFDFDVPINIISHDIDYINLGLSFGQYFFTDIINKGILLYDRSTSNFETARVLNPEEAKRKAEEYYNIWFNQGVGFLEGAFFYYQKQNFRISVFSLHQAAECFYSTILLVFIGYKPKAHNLSKLRSFIKNISKELYALFPSNSKNEMEVKLFNLLKRGYIDARYSLEYNISSDEVFALINKLERMKSIVMNLCDKKMALM